MPRAPLTSAFLLAFVAWAQARGPDARSLLSTAVGTIYANGDLSWRSWSWGLSQLSVRDPMDPMPGAKFSLCMSVQPFGALSLRSSMPFPLEGVLGFYIRGSGNKTTAASLGHLELQFESSQPSRYAITRSLTLGEILSAQAAAQEGGVAGTAAAGGSSPDLQSAQAGRWTAVKAPLPGFFPQQADVGFKADRLTLGLCLQKLEGCSAATPSIDVCIDKLLIVSSS